MESTITMIGSVLATAVLAYLTGDTSTHVMGFPTLYWCAVIAMGIQWVAYIPAIILKTEHFYDLVGAATYVIVVVFAYVYGSADGDLCVRRLALTMIVCVWALRLGVYLGRRVHKVGKDGRFDDIKVSPLRFGMAWTVQGLWVFLTSLSVTVVLTSKSESSGIDTPMVLGLIIWMMGFGIECVADAQKSRFKADPANEGRWIDSGLWRYSQHPNYFGEVMLWTGIFVSGVSTYSGWQWLAALSPVFVYLLLRYGSGVPLLQERGDAKWGDDPDYRAYRAETNLFLPGPGVKKRNPR